MRQDYSELKVLKRGGMFYYIPPAMAILRGTDAQSSANFTTRFFTADRDYEIVEVKEQHDVAATDGSVDVVKTPDGTAAASGTSILSSAMPLTGAANTLQTATLSAVAGANVLLRNESLACNATGLLTSLQGAAITVYLKAI